MILLEKINESVRSEEGKERFCDAKKRLITYYFSKHRQFENIRIDVVCLKMIPCGIFSW